MPPGRWSRFPRHVSAAEKRARIEAASARLGKQLPGGQAQPIRLDGRTITSTFWGNAWCENLQSYADLAYRLDRGRNYLRTGAVVDLRIEAGRIQARVAGTRLYKIQIAIAAIEARRWQRIARASTGRIGSLVGLLRGELPDEVMQAVTDREQGLFPKPAEMQMTCDCPDRASLCKHLAATLYGVGVRLDTRPELLFLLRGVYAQDLVEQATAGLAGGAAAAPVANTLAGGLDDLAALFGIELSEAPAAKRRRKTTPARRRRGRKTGA
jgi:uncharacterized Zn finger protein